MTRKDIFNTLITVISKIKQTDYRNEEITEESYLGGELGVSSVEMLETMYDVQREFQIKINDEDMADIYTVKDAIDLVERYLGE